MMSYRENLQKCHEYVRGLEEERRKIQMFQKELPLCLEIITQTIESCKQQLPGTITATTTTTTTECSEQTTSDDLVFEEFMPIKMQNSPAPGSTYRDREEGEEEEEDNSELESRKTTSSIDVSQKSDWLRSAQLWNQSPDPPTREEEEGEKNSRMLQVRKVSVVEVTQSTTPTTEIATQSTSCSRSGGSKEGRKSRRCWSPELHRRFLNALEQLGGPHVATPKQIRELMKVDGLTNDEVKSHLQKYRLHSSRRPTTNNSNSTQAAPQFVVVGGMWVPPTNSRDAVAPGGAPVGQHQPHHHAATNITDITNNNSNNNGGRCCNSSPQTSSSSAPPTTTPSPACN